MTHENHILPNLLVMAWLVEARDLEPDLPLITQIVRESSAAIAADRVSQSAEA